MPLLLLPHFLLLAFSSAASLREKRSFFERDYDYSSFGGGFERSFGGYGRPRGYAHPNIYSNSFAGGYGQPISAYEGGYGRPEFSAPSTGYGRPNMGYSGSSESYAKPAGDNYPAPPPAQPAYSPQQPSLGDFNNDASQPPMDRPRVPPPPPADPPMSGSPGSLPPQVEVPTIPNPPGTGIEIAENNDNTPSVAPMDPSLLNLPQNQVPPSAKTAEMVQ